MNLPPVESEPESRPDAPLRFTYPSGSRPLEGYTIKRGVGRGGFGEVYFAVSDAGKEVALKLIRRNLDVELRGVKQCLNLKHQNLVALYDIRSDELDDRWVVMEFVSGESLEDVIDRHPAGMPLDLALHWFSGIAAGVAYLHDHGIVHRDLKPANIFLDEGIVKIGDYGLSKFISCSRRSGQTESVGTVHYMAPEIANGRYGKEIDTYALGIILYEMLTGHVPFQGESVGEVLMKHLTAEPDLAALEEPYRGMVQRAMAKDPELRIKNVSELTKELPESAGATPGPTPSYASRPIPNTVPYLGSKRVPEEPIAAAVRDSWNWLVTRTDALPPIFKGIAGVILVGLTLVTAELWIIPALIMGIIYLVYYGLRAAFLAGSTSYSAPADTVKTQQTAKDEQNAQQTDPEQKQARRHYSRRRRHTWQQQLQEHVAAKPFKSRLTELLGSMLMATVFASLLSIFGISLVYDNPTTESYIWMAIVGTIGSWAVMVPGKFMEGHIEDQAPMRFGMLIAGALVGSLAWVIADGFLLEFSTQGSIGPDETLAGEFFRTESQKALFDEYRSGAVHLTLPMSTAYFAFLFVVLRWWRQAEYSRNSRVSIWSVFVCVVTAFFMTFIWWFPQPLGAVIAGTLACTVQFSSPWMPPSRRRALAESGA